MRIATLLLALACAGDARQAAAGECPTLRRSSPTRSLFHDPDGVWTSDALIDIRLEESRPDATLRRTRVELDRATGRVLVESERRSVIYQAIVQGDDVGFNFVGLGINDEMREELGLDDAGLRRQRNYYEYLYGLPMKQRDPGTILGKTTRFQGRDVHSLKVTYDPEVGDDTWYFYFDRESSELVGYRFHHDEAAGDGEYIVLEGLAEVAGLRLPKARTWYMNQDDELLGTDTIVNEG